MVVGLNDSFLLLNASVTVGLNGEVIEVIDNAIAGLNGKLWIWMLKLYFLIVWSLHWKQIQLLVW